MQYSTYFQRTFLLLQAALVFVLATSATPSQAEGKWRNVSAKWKISCGVDKGAIKKSRKTYVFSTSSNQCVSRGTFTQRAEIRGVDIKLRKPMRYMFETTMQLKAGSSQSFTLFQIHDGRGSCAPPLKLDWHSDNRLRFRSSYSLDKGVHDCVDNRPMQAARYSGPRLRRNGASYKLQVILDFDGTGGFDVVVSVDGARVLAGTYKPPNDERYFKSERYYMKHGVYSKHMWDYEFTSQDIRVYRQKPR